MSRRFTRRSSGCAAPAPRRRPSRAGASATRRAPWTAISCRCCRRSPRPTMPPGARGRRNDRVPRRSERATVSAVSELDREAMQRALTLAERGLAGTDPNPRVGCVIAQGERIVGEGWHERAGEAHAEVMALEAAGAQAAGATVSVTLEPCSHHGRTPPCVEALLRARVARVVYAATDPNPEVNGRGAAALRAGGVAVEGGLLEREALELNCGFAKRMREGRPWVRLKLGMSLDGRTALATGESRWITGEAAREDVQHWRARSSAILTGIGTVLADDPRLDVRLPAEAAGQPGTAAESPRQPLRVVLDSHLRTPPGARLLTGGGEVLILTAQRSLKDVQSGSAPTARAARRRCAPHHRLPPPRPLARAARRQHLRAGLLPHRYRGAAAGFRGGPLARDARAHDARGARAGRGGESRAGAAGRGAARRAPAVRTYRRRRAGDRGAPGGAFPAPAHRGAGRARALPRAQGRDRPGRGEPPHPRGRGGALRLQPHSPHPLGDHSREPARGLSACTRGRPASALPRAAAGAAGELTPRLLRAGPPQRHELVRAGAGSARVY